MIKCITSVISVVATFVNKNIFILALALAVALLIALKAYKEVKKR